MFAKPAANRIDMAATDFPDFESLIDQWLLTPDAEVEALVRQHRVLPISADVGGAYFFRLVDRQVVFCAWGSDGGLYLEEPSLRMNALVVGAKKYPQLRSFLPERPSDAPDCVKCHGTGTIMKSFGCGACWSLGWLHEMVNGIQAANALRSSVASRLKAWLFKRSN